MVKPETVEDALNADLASLGDLPRGAETLAATAVALARELDRDKNSATSKSMCARALLETMERLTAMAGEHGEVSPLAEILKRRDRRAAAPKN